MGTDESDVDHPIRIIDPDNDTILVARYIEDSAAILENTGAADISLDVRRLCPVRLPHLPKPGHHRLMGIGYTLAAVEESLDRAERYHPHDTSLA